MFASTTLPRICFSLENGHDRAVIGAVDVILDLVAGQGGVQGLDGGVALVAFLHDQNVGVGLGSLRGCVLGGKSILADGEASLDCVVAVDDGKVNILHGAGQLGSLDFLDLHVMGVLGDVVDGGGQTGAVTHGDQTLSGQQLQLAGEFEAVSVQEAVQIPDAQEPQFKTLSGPIVRQARYRTRDSKSMFFLLNPGRTESVVRLPGADARRCTVLDPFTGTIMQERLNRDWTVPAVRGIFIIIEE